MRRLLFLLFLLFFPAACRQPTPTPVDAPGSLIFARWDEETYRLERLRLASGELEILFTLPPRATLSDAAVSPDGRQIALAYAPPVSAGQMQLGRSDLYLLAMAPDALPRPLLDTAVEGETYMHPAWSPDGAWLYFTHARPEPNAADPYRGNSAVSRLDVAEGKVTVLAENARWPVLSSDGRFLAYLSAEDPLRPALWLAAPDGGNARLLVPPGRFSGMATPLFSPDGNWIYFGGEQMGDEASVSWWRIPTTGGEPRPLSFTGLSAPATPRDMGGAFVVDSVGEVRFLAISAPQGLYLFSPHGGPAQQILSAQTLPLLTWTADSQ